MKQLLLDFLWTHLYDLGAFREPGQSPEAAHESAGLAPGYAAWFEECLRIFETAGYLERSDGRIFPLGGERHRPGAELWHAWDAQKPEWRDNPDLSATFQLVETTLRAFPDILTGRRAATDVMFPGGSMKLVEDAYTTNPASAFFNQVLATDLVSRLRDRARITPGEAARILEIGAGTGATSAVVLDALRSARVAVAEYCYTDVSRAFLDHARTSFGPANPFLSYGILNVESPVAGQGIDPGGYDVVIAANVLHATRDIRTTLRNAKAALKPGGLLVLNELTANNVLSQFSFGLLEGWWRYEDAGLRIPGSPLLSAAGWQQVLTESGFGTITWPAQEAADLGQQIIVAESDGVIRQAAARVPEPAVAEKPAPPESSRPTTVDTEPGNRSHVESVILDVLAEALQIPRSRIERDEPFSTYGLDSIYAVTVARAVGSELDIDLDITVMFEYGTLAELAEFIVTDYAEELQDVLPPEPVPDEPTPGRDESASEAMAIVGMSARFPGAEDIEQFWQIIEQCKRVISAPPAGRPDWASQAAESSGLRGGFLGSVHDFDPLFFRMSVTEAEQVAPELRLMLMTAWNAIEDAGYRPAEVRRRPTGVFVATTQSEYRPAESGLLSLPSTAMVPNRISYLLDLSGPSEQYDTTCSSSLVALHRAIRAIRAGECEQALVGGVNLVASPAGNGGMQAAGMISASGDVRPFQQDADGTVRSEGVAAVLIKPLSRALADGDFVHAVVRGTGVAHGGRGLSFTAPNIRGMKAAIARAYEDAELDPSAVDYVETHGMSTILADGAELAALTAGLRGEGGRDGESVTYLGNLKPCIGHTEVVSGLAALVKVVRALRQKLIPAVPDFGRLHSDLSLDGTGLQIATENLPWATRAADDRGRTPPRRAAVHSFGIGGVNAHVVLEEHVAEDTNGSDPGRQVLVLSAKSSEALRERAHALIKVLTESAAGSWADLAYTLQIGREEMSHRLAFIAQDAQEAAGVLERWLDGEAPQQQDGVTEGWVAGSSVDWSLLHQGARRRRVPLPGYPFARLTCFAKQASAPAASTAPTGAFDVAEDDFIADFVASVLGLAAHEIDRTTPLADYGLNSLLLVAMLGRIRDAFPGFRPEWLQPNDTLDDVVARLSGLEVSPGAAVTRPRHPELVHLNGVTEGRPVFWIHGALAGVESYTTIAELLDRPFYGIQARGLLSEDPPIEGIAAMAGCYAEIIGSVQPEGPYDIGGFCLGGIVAYEVTRLLQERGHRVETLTMVDSPDETGLAKSNATGFQSARTAALQVMNSLLWPSEDQSPETLRARLIHQAEVCDAADEEAFVRRLAALAAGRGLAMRPEQIVRFIRRNMAIQLAYGLGEHTIRPLPRPGDVRSTYFRNRRGLFLGELEPYFQVAGETFSLDRVTYWQDWERELPNLRILDIDAANHMTILNDSGPLSAIEQACVQIYGGEEHPAREPIAIVGIGCRLPAHVDSPATLWTALLEGVDAVREMPADRWNAADWNLAQPASRRGGFLDDVTGFDAEFFGISPAEARQMDPQQRIALEVACAALEDARRSPAALAGSHTGVYLGAMWQEYPLFAQGAADSIHTHSAIGWDNSVIPSRIAYALGLRGPAMTVATASSSSLVAVHLAVQSLRSGESDYALAGGVSLMLHPNTSVAMTKLGTQSPDGRCQAFDADGDGYARGEGCAMVVLRRLSDALADGDRIYAVVHGSAVNNDGATDGLTAPSREAQAEVLRSAWENAGVPPRSVAYVEAHGTGTPLGDVTEAGALGSVFAADDRAEPLRLGSAKTNFGHLEPAAGILGLVKVALALHHGAIPPSLHFRTPNPRIDFAGDRLEVVTKVAQWPAGPRFAGVSSFGFGGTNAHVALGEAVSESPGWGEAAVGTAVLGEATARSEPGPGPEPEPLRSGPVCLPVSGMTSQALAQNAARLADHLAATPQVRLADIAYSLATTRTHHPVRGAVVAATSDEAATRLRALAADDDDDAVVTGSATERGRTVFVFPGQGAQWWGMGRALWEHSEVFRTAVAACDDALAPHTGWSVAAVVRGVDDAAPAFTRTDVVQPALFAMYVGLAALWRSWGVEPAAVVGHSQGEVAAAVVSGALSLADGAHIVAARARAVHEHAVAGAMGLVARPVEEVLERLAPYGNSLSVAVVNTARSTVVAGDVGAVERFLAEMEAAGAFCQRVDVDYASHSPHMDPLLAGLRQELAGLAPGEAKIPFYSSVSGERLAGPELDAQYWCRNLREPVRFDRALTCLRHDGFGVFVEVSPHPVLGVALAQGTEDDESAVVVGSLRRDRGGLDQALLALAEVHVLGVPVAWDRVQSTPHARRVDLPTYAFQHRHYWLDDDDPVPAADVSSWREEVMALPEAERLGRLVALVAGEAATLLGRSGQAIRTDMALRQQGFDSLMVVELRNRLSARTNVALPAALAFDYPTPAAIAALLLTHTDSSRVTSTTAAASPALPPARLPSPDRDDPIAIVSMACRLPDGIETPEAFWDLLVEGREASGPFPKRWDAWDLGMLDEAQLESTGQPFVRRGGFVHDVEDFDAAFFGLSPREAFSLDPQQRLVLEVVWEALERANVRPETLAGSDTGVYLGAMSSDYDISRRWDVESIDGYKLTGNESSLISGRVAYTLGLSGPALTIDTACSSSLVALQLACAALRSGECDLALAGGVTVMSTPQIFVEFSRLGGLAGDGRCKSFAEEADGTSWAEGCGVLVVKRLSDAERDGDRVLALVRGAAMSQDGRSQGLTAPNGLAQQRVLRGALADAGLTPADLDAVEAHATGTVLGDPIEAGALAAVFAGRISPLLLGSAKSNIGHAQAASGVIGVIKMVLAMRHELLPRTLHAAQPNSNIDWSGGELELLQRARPWPRNRRVRRAGVSSFGISGTNAHVIIEEPPAAIGDAAGEDDDRAYPIVISGLDQAALQSQVQRWAAWLATGPSASLRDIAYTSAVGRTRFEARAVVFARSTGEAAEALRSDVARSRVAFVLPDQDAPWPGMGRDLLKQSPVFREAVAGFGATVLAVLRGDEGAPGLSHPDVASSALSAMRAGLMAMWRSWGVEPSVVVGDEHCVERLRREGFAIFYPLEWERVLQNQGARTVDVPTYAFQRQRFWLGEPAARPVATGQLPATHPWFGAMTTLAGTGGHLFTGLLSSAEHRYLADHVVAGSVLVPGAGLLDAALWAARESGAGAVSDLTMLEPVVLEPSRALRLQASLGAVDEHGRHSFALYSQPENSPDRTAWQLHVSGECAPGAADAPRTPPQDLCEWPVPDAKPVDIEAFYASAADIGLDYGPAFQGLRELFSREGVYYARVSLPDSLEATGLHPALFDAALQVVVVGLMELDAGAEAAPLVPFIFSDVELYQGAGRELRVRVEFEAPGEDRLPAAMVWLADVDGAPVARVGRVKFQRGKREISEHLYRVGFEPAELVWDVPGLEGTVVIGDGALPDLDTLVQQAPRRLLFAMPPGSDDAENSAVGVLRTLQLCLGDERLQDTELVWLTRDAVSSSPDDRVDNWTDSAVWGMVRSARAEQSDRVLRLIDLDHDDPDRVLLARALATVDEPECVVRGGTVLVPRARPTGDADLTADRRRLDPNGTVLITGGLGELGRALAAHLVREHGARHLLLLSRRGGEADSAAAVVRELQAAGAEQVDVVAADVADRAALAAVLDGIDPEHPLTAVFHLAGVLDDGLVEGLTPERLRRVMAPKVRGARHLDELTEGMDLAAFVLFSSAAGTLGTAGQSAYAAANATLDALAAHRRRRGLPALSLAFGLWEQSGVGMTAHLGRAELGRLRRQGIGALTVSEGLHALDVALTRPEAHLMPVHLEPASLGDAETPPMLRALVSNMPDPARAVGASGRSPEAGESLAAAGESAEMPSATPSPTAPPLDGDRLAVLLDIVRGEAATVLGLPGPDSVPVDRVLRSLGMDSLTMVELRKRLSKRMNTKLPATLVFDYPTAEAIAGLLLGIGGEVS